ncbi:hypothetical protein Hdeb2414_s0005g00156191 [Helianthus debilis subsp. tardiflorus]
MTGDVFRPYDELQMTTVVGTTTAGGIRAAQHREGSSGRAPISIVVVASGSPTRQGSGSLVAVMVALGSKTRVKGSGTTCTT